MDLSGIEESQEEDSQEVIDVSSGQEEEEEEEENQEEEDNDDEEEEDEDDGLFQLPKEKPKELFELLEKCVPEPYRRYIGSTRVGVERYRTLGAQFENRVKEATAFLSQEQIKL